MIFSEDSEISGALYYKTHDIELALEQYTPDFDENKNIHTDVYYIDMAPNADGTLHQISQTKLMSEIGLANAQIYIADKAQLTTILGDQEESSGFENLSALYPDDPQIVDKYYYKVKGSPFAETALYVEGCPEDLYIAVRSNDFSGYAALSDDILEYHRRALEVLDNIVNERKVNLTEDENEN